MALAQPSKLQSEHSDTNTNQALGGVPAGGFFFPPHMYSVPMSSFPLTQILHLPHANLFSQIDDSTGKVPGATDMSLSLRKPKTWPYAASSTGRHRGSLPFRAFGLRVQVYEAVGEARTIFVEQLSGTVIAYINQNATKIQISGSYVDLSLFMMGKAPDRTKPMVMIVSEDKDARLEAFRLVKDSGIMENYPGFDLGHMPLKAEFENLQPLGGAASPGFSPDTLTTAPIMENYPGFNLGHMPLRTELGDLHPFGGPESFGFSREMLATTPNQMGHDVFTASSGSSMFWRRLYVFGRGNDQGTARLATSGGVVHASGRFYLHTVQHVFASPPPTPRKSFPETEYSPDDEWDATGMDDFDDDEDDDDDSLAAITSRGSQTPPWLRSYTSETEPADSPFFEHQSRHTEFAAGLSNKLERLGGNGEDAGESLTSSPRATDYDSVPQPHETLVISRNDKNMTKIGEPVLISEQFDSVLIPIDLDLAKKLGISISDMGRDALPLEDFDHHIETSPRDTAIQTTTSNAGLVRGSLSGSPSFVRLPNTTVFQEVYLAKMETPLVSGDCGSWIRNAATGKIFGHVVGGSPTTGLAIIMPANKTFAHMRDAIKSENYLYHGKQAKADFPARAPGFKKHLLRVFSSMSPASKSETSCWRCKASHKQVRIVATAATIPSPPVNSLSSVVPG